MYSLVTATTEERMNVSSHARYKTQKTENISAPASSYGLAINESNSMQNSAKANESSINQSNGT
jgi:hypothetical protein